MKNKTKTIILKNGEVLSIIAENNPKSEIVVVCENNKLSVSMSKNKISDN